MFESLHKENLHHAYLLLGPRGEVKSALTAFLEEVTKGELKGNPDVEFLIYESMTAIEIRDFVVRATQTPLGKKRFFILEIAAFAVAGNQNIFLKTFEDPVPGVHFFVLAEHEGIFLDTLLSRFYILRHGGVRALDFRSLAEKFLAASSRGRLELIKPFTEKLEEPEEKRKQRRDAAEFLHAVQRVLEEKLPKSARAEKALREIAVFEKYFTDAAFNSRLVLEHLSLVL